MGIMDFLKRNIGFEPYMEDEGCYEFNQEKDNGLKDMHDNGNKSIPKELNESQETKKVNIGKEVHIIDGKLVEMPPHENGVVLDSKFEQRGYEKGKKSYTPYYYKPVEKQNVIIFVLENRHEVSARKNEIIGLLKRIVDKNNTSLFWFLKLGNDEEFYDILDYSDINKKEILENMLSAQDKNEAKVDMEKALTTINDFFHALTLKLGNFEFKEKKYDIQNISIIFIGTADYDLKSKKEIIHKFRLIKKFGRIKTIKYFCMEDKETVNAAMLGFPVIGHIESDFYK